RQTFGAQHRHRQGKTSHQNNILEEFQAPNHAKSCRATSKHVNAATVKASTTLTPLLDTNTLISKEFRAIRGVTRAKCHF
ncbi:MAG: hypothetical protein Q7T25_04370, partial [Sideroxyarcus sp.]|nr:hypothetical protein [Sideroxyarcus sp.]